MIYYYTIYLAIYIAIYSQTCLAIMTLFSGIIAMQPLKNHVFTLVDIILCSGINAVYPLKNRIFTAKNTQAM
ncbi:hypothetical protein COTS27_00691 [Spirochaetota bacterium]|nr:hypothetical protein COTS27_00691 [Spirochaetota bacterium]